MLLTACDGAGAAPKSHAKPPVPEAQATASALTSDTERAPSALGRAAAAGSLGPLQAASAASVEPPGQVGAPPSLPPPLASGDGRAAVSWLSPIGASVRLDTSIEVMFTSEVDPKSVEQHVSVVPPVELSFSWSSPTRLSMAPKEALRPGTTYQLEVSGSLTNQAPLPVTSWSFRTVFPAPKQIVPGRGGNLILSFDDGPRGEVRTRRLLALLARHRVKALFFPTAQNLKRYPRWVAEVEAAGHRVCNHSYTHPNLTALSEAALRREIELGAGHGRCRLFRPPMMAYSPRVREVAEELGYELYLWDVDTRDWESIGAREITNRVLRGARPGAVVLFHIQAKHTLRALKRLLPRLERAGYVFSWDPRDVEREAFGAGLEQTWLTDPAAQRARWLESFEADAGAPAWPFAR